MKRIEGQLNQGFSHSAFIVDFLVILRNAKNPWQWFKKFSAVMN
jgi:hypothetical protein